MPPTKDARFLTTFRDSLKEDVRRSTRSGTVIVLLVMILAATGLALNSVQHTEEANRQIRATNERVQKFNECNARVVTEIVNALNARTDFADNDRNALNTFILELTHSKSQAESQRIVTDYLNTIQKSNEQRAKNPLPAPPTETCHF